MLLNFDAVLVDSDGGVAVELELQNLLLNFLVLGL